MTDISAQDRRVLQIAKALAALGAVEPSEPPATLSDVESDKSWLPHWAEAKRFMAVERALDKAGPSDEGIRPAQLNSANDG